MRKRYEANLTRNIATLTLGFLFAAKLSIGVAETLQYDDGASDLSVSPWTDLPGSEIAVKFTPTTYPVRLDSVRFYIKPEAQPETPFGIRIYTESNGAPDYQIDPGTLSAAATAGDQWVEVDLSGRDIRILEGEFFVGIYWTTPPGISGQGAQMIGLDTSSPIDGRSYWRWPGGQWSTPDSGSDNYGDVMIRADVSFVNGLQVSPDIAMNLDSPSNGQPYSGTGIAFGWAVSPDGIDSVELYIDGISDGNIPMGGKRPDVLAVYSGYPGAEGAGFSTAFGYGNLADGAHTFVLRAYDALGRYQDFRAAFDTISFGRAFIADPGLVSLDAVLTETLGNEISLSGMLVGADNFDVVLRWNTAAQGFEIFNIERNSDL